MTPWTVAHQAPLSREFSRQEYWSGLPFPPPLDHLNPGIEPASVASPALSGGFFTTRATWEDCLLHIHVLIESHRHSEFAEGGWLYMCICSCFIYLFLLVRVLLHHVGL